MTATSINGVAVIASEPAESKISVSGRPVYFKQIMKLLLEDGTEAYGCAHCDWTANGAPSVRSHLKKHSTKARTPKAEDWEARALRAEHELAAIRGTSTPSPTHPGLPTRAVMFETFEQVVFFYLIKRSIVSKMRQGLPYPTGLVLQRGRARQFGLLKEKDYFGIPLTIEPFQPLDVRLLFRDEWCDVHISSLELLLRRN